MLQKHAGICVSIVLLSLTQLYALERIKLQDERRIAYRMRTAAARTQTIARPLGHITQPNPDEVNVPNYAGSFTKGFDHDLVTSVATPIGQENFEQLVKAMTTGDQADFNAINFCA